MKNEYGTVLKVGRNWLLILHKSFKNPKGGQKWYQSLESAQKGFAKFC